MHKTVDIRIKIITSDLRVFVNDHKRFLYFDFDMISALHTQLSKKYPDCFVHFTWKPLGANQASFICGARYGQIEDEKRLHAGEMSWEQYAEKWDH